MGKWEHAVEITNVGIDCGGMVGVGGCVCWVGVQLYRRVDQKEIMSEECKSWDSTVLRCDAMRCISWRGKGGSSHDSIIDIIIPLSRPDETN